MIARLTALAIAATIPAAATAAPPDQPALTADPNEKICETVTQIGSRLSRKRICATRAEWAQRRLQDRQDAEQIQKSLTGSTCTPTKTNGISTC